MIWLSTPLPIKSRLKNNLPNTPIFPIFFSPRQSCSPDTHKTWPKPLDCLTTRRTKLTTAHYYSSFAYRKSGARRFTTTTEQSSGVHLKNAWNAAENCIPKEFFFVFFFLERKLVFKLKKHCAGSKVCFITLGDLQSARWAGIKRGAGLEAWYNLLYDIKNQQFARPKKQFGFNCC